MGGYAVVNYLLYGMIKSSESLKPFLFNMAALQSLLGSLGMKMDIDKLQVLSVEEIYTLLLKVAPKVSVSGSGKAGKAGGKAKGDKGDKGDSEGQDQEGDGKSPFDGKCEPDLKSVIKSEGEGEDEDKDEVLQEGDPEIYGQIDAETIAEGFLKSILQAYSAQKIAGTVPEGLQRLIDKMLQAKVNWKTLLKQAYQHGMGRTVVANYRRQSRKHADLPGLQRFTYPTIHCLVDCSGSINTQELEQFVGELYSLAKTSSLVVTSWDASAYEDIQARSQRDVVGKVMSKLKGGGGTIVAPALAKTLARMRLKDVVIILSDGEIFDLTKSETVDLFQKVAARSSVAIIATTKTEVEVSQWYSVKIDTE